MVISMRQPDRSNPRPKSGAHGATITTDAGFCRLPLPPEYRAHRDDIAPIACENATRARRSQSKSRLQKSISKLQLQAFGMFPGFRNAPPFIFHRAVVTTSRSIPLKLLSDGDEVCATGCLKFGRRATAQRREERENLRLFEGWIQSAVLTRVHVVSHQLRPSASQSS